MKAFADDFSKIISLAREHLNFRENTHLLFPRFISSVALQLYVEKDAI